MINKLLRPVWHRLLEQERHSILLELTKQLPEGFALERFERFEQFGQSNETAVFTYEGSEFVFVPGDEVVLGWEQFAVGMNDETLEDIMESLAEWGIEDIDPFLRSCMSPVRQVRIDPMIVERKTNPIGWRRVPIDCQEIREDTELAEFVQNFLQGSYNDYTLADRLRLRRSGSELIADLCDSISYDAFIVKMQQDGFSLPSEDEWEYLCGGGTRTLFRWGDSFDYDMYLRHFEEEASDHDSYTLEQPGPFGVMIAHDPYQYEVTRNALLKGGDGGANICGGMGPALGYLPTATYYRDLSLVDDPDWTEDVSGNFARRVIKL